MPTIHTYPQHHPSHHTQPLGMSAALLAELSKPYYRKLLDDAKALNSDANEMAIVLCQAASEIATEAAITSLLAIRNDQDLVEPILNRFSVPDICNDDLCKIFSALAGDDPKKQPFWPKLKAHKKRRNDVVHRGERVTRGDAIESVAVVDAYIKYLEAILAGVTTRSP